MIGCVSEGLRQTYGDEWMEANSDWRAEKKGDNTSATTEPIYVSTAKVFSQTVALSTIDTAWGGNSDNPVFSIFMLSSEAASKVASYDDPKKMPKGYPCFRIQIKGNLSFPLPLSIYYSSGVYDKLAMEYIDCLAVEYDEHGYVTLYLDKTKISALSPRNCNFITVYGKDMPNGEGTLEEYCNLYGSVDWFQLIPCTVAFAPTNVLYKKIGRFNGWLADLIIMNEAGANEFPSNVEQPELSKAHTLSEINYVIGSVSSESTMDASRDNLTDGTYTFVATKSGLQWFKFIIAGNAYDYEVGAIDSGEKSLGVEIPLKNDSYTYDVKFMAEKGKKYSIHYYIHNNSPYCQINEQIN